MTPPVSPPAGFDDALRATLRVVIDRLVPRDEFASATDAGVDRYIEQQLAGDCAAEAPLIAAGLGGIEAEAHARHAVSFAQLTAVAQDALLAELERRATTIEWTVDAALFFARLVELTGEGYYADPANGGNRDGVSWVMLGYRPRSARPVQLAATAPKEK